MSRSRAPVRVETSALPQHVLGWSLLLTGTPDPEQPDLPDDVDRELYTEGVGDA